MSTPSFTLKSRRVVTPQGVREAIVVVRDGRIAHLASPDASIDVEHDVGDAVVMAGVFDAHVHINEPGRTHWEGFETATRAAAAGGVTGVVDMPLNSIPSTTTRDAFEQKLAATSEKLHVDVGFWGGVVPGNTHHLEPLWERGVLGFKCFLAPSGVDEFEHVGEHELREAMPTLAALGAPLLVHAELPGPIAAAASVFETGDRRSYATYLASRPRAAEDEAIAMMIALCREFDAPVHIVHLASSDALPRLREARAEGLALSVETCAHYLFFCAEDIPDGATEYKCAPPLRERENQELLWEALCAGDIDMVTTDHSPSPPELKRRDTGTFDDAWGGVASLQLLLPATWTAAREREVDLVTLSRWLSERPAALAGVSARKGRIAPGLDADLVVWHPEKSFEVEAETLHHRHRLTPYLGRRLYGVVETTYVRGHRVFHQGVVDDRRRGQPILREVP